MVAATALFATGQSVNAQSHDPKEDEDGVEAHGKVIQQINPDPGKLHASRPRGGGGGNGIYYHGGPLIVGTGGVNVYAIWYGNWANNTATNIIADFLNSEGGSPYYHINTTYYNGSNVHLLNEISFLGSTTDNYSQGTSLGDAQIQAIVSSAISSKRLPPDSNGVYFVLTSSDVSETSGFCNQYCGWHTHGTISGIDIKYAFVGNPDRCPNACEAQTASSPNGNTGADGMVSVIAHELEEAASDPDLNAWFDSRGEENADKCAWTFGTTYPVGNGSLANMKLGTRNFLIQQNWVNANGGYCALQF
jgi:hypothetical protein